MNGINKITDRIAAEARDEIAAMQEETTVKCREIEEAYDKLAREEYQKIVSAGVKDCELQSKRLAGAAAMEAKKNVLAMKQDAVDKVLTVATERICNLPEETYTLLLARLAGNAAFTGTEEVIFNRRDKGTVARAVVKYANDVLKKRGIMPKLTVCDETGDFMGGVMVKQGDIEVNCSIEKLVELSRDKLAAQIAEVLFSD